MAKKKAVYKKTSRPRQATHNTHADFGTLEIETNPPPVRLRGHNPETDAFLARMRNTVLSLKPSNAFIIPAQQRATTRRYLRKEYLDMFFIINPVTGNDKVLRVYFVRYVNQPK